ncbi:hypothetical protein Moror_6449 [Moniliophthora roreri MCA 2997]|uniref:Uncharacterized protein n=2 Tax=Moniliophthora roreri TaxID=221103 RepID=V2XVH2_MONRO|nr:hypothetical protein Moror_6449 [Moniliophthora roreri MCA 2997]KAI3610674.1 hypothetical protein WG66_007083 [Moniliophthora roreri]
MNQIATSVFFFAVFLSPLLVRAAPAQTVTLWEFGSLTAASPFATETNILIPIGTAGDKSETTYRLEGAAVATDANGDVAGGAIIAQTIVASASGWKANDFTIDLDGVATAVADVDCALTAPNSGACVLRAKVAAGGSTVTTTTTLAGQASGEPIVVSEVGAGNQNSAATPSQTKNSAPMLSASYRGCTILNIGAAVLGIVAGGILIL